MHVPVGCILKHFWTSLKDQEHCPLDMMLMLICSSGITVHDQTPLRYWQWILNKKDKNKTTEDGSNAFFTVDCK